MAFLREPEPKRGEALVVIPGVRRIVANNPSLMTYHGTNTYLIDCPDGCIVLDPGPDDGSHVQDIVRATGGRVSAIFLSHSHADHLGATAALKALTGAATHGYEHTADPSFEPDVLLRDGQQVAGLTAIFTPGHASDHLCFAWRGDVVFSADHVMSWSSSIVSPPGGDMAQYFRSLRRMLERDEDLYLPGHGPILPDARSHVGELLAHRVRREEAILQALREGSMETWDLVDKLYSKTDPWLRRAAERNVTAHLMKLQSEGLAAARSEASDVALWDIRR